MVSNNVCPVRYIAGYITNTYKPIGKNYYNYSTNILNNVDIKLQAYVILMEF